MRKILKISWIILRSFIIFMLLSFTTVVIIEHISKDVLVQNFISKGEFQEELSTDKIKYYKIPYNGRKTISYDPLTHDCYPGEKGDILVSPEQTTIAPLLNEVISFYAGGHAGYCLGEYGDYQVISNNYMTLETTETQTIHKTSLYSKNDWTTPIYFNSVIGLRVDMTDEEIDEVTSAIMSYYDDPYNKTFFFNTTNAKYCSDLISEGFKYVNKNLNRDSSTTSIYDLIVSADTYIFYYHYFDSKGVKYVYYLG